MDLPKILFLLFFGIVVIIKPTALLTKRFDRPRYDSPLILAKADQSYDKSTMRLWRGFGIGMTIFALWFLLKYFKLL